MPFFWQFFQDFSGHGHSREKIPTVLESAHLAGSNYTHFEYIIGEKKMVTKGGTL